jgi:hypothetical protein
MLAFAATLSAAAVVGSPRARVLQATVLPARIAAPRARRASLLRSARRRPGPRMATATTAARSEDLPPDDGDGPPDRKDKDEWEEGGEDEEEEHERNQEEEHQSRLALEQDELEDAARGEPTEAADGPPDQNSMSVYKNATGRKLPFQGDELPFNVTVVSPPPHSLGQFMLNPRTNCGDVIEHDEKSYVVKRVICHYRLQFGRPQMFKKTIEIKSLARKSLESFLEKTFNES